MGITENTAVNQLTDIEKPLESFLGRTLPVIAQVGLFGVSALALSAIVSPLTSAAICGLFIGFRAYYNSKTDYISDLKKSYKKHVIVCPQGDKAAIQGTVPFLNQHPRFFNDLNTLSKRAGLEHPPIVFFNTNRDDPIGAAAGCHKNAAKNVLLINCVTLSHLNRAEMNSVVAHELIHMKKDVSFHFRALWLISSAFSLAAGNFIGIVAATIVSAIYSRHAETIADRGSAYITNNPLAGAKALEKAYKNSLPITAGVPLCDGVVSAIKWAIGSHPPVAYRVKQLEQLDKKFNAAAARKTAELKFNPPKNQVKTAKNPEKYHV